MSELGFLEQETSMPASFIVLAGGWERGPSPELTIETQMRIGGFAVAAAQLDSVEHVIFTGGLVSEGVTEAAAMVDFTKDHYSDAAHKTAMFHIEDYCFDTSSSARNVRQTLDDNNITGPVGFITSATHMKRAHGLFLRNGFDTDQLVPMTAESLLSQGDEASRQMAAEYTASMRYKTRLAIELGLRALAKVDPNDTLVQRLALLTRSTNSSEAKSL